MRFTFLWLLLLPSVSVAQGRVLVVDDGGGGGGAYTDIQTAVDESTHGDTVLVWSGTYAGFNVVNKAIAVIADAGEVVLVNGTVQVRNLAADRDVLLGRLQIAGATGGLAYQGTGLYLKNDLGSVRVQGCDLQAVAAHPGALVEGSLDVSLNDCRAFGGAGLSGATWPGCEGGAGVSAASSSVAVYFSDLRGGAASVGSWGSCQGCPGGSGLSSTTSSFLHAAGTLLTGVNGADALDGCQPSQNFLCNGGNGGHGANLRVLGFDPEPQTFWSYGNAFATGTGGEGGTGMCGCGLFTVCDGEAGEPGLAVQSFGADSVQVSARLSPLLEVMPNPARETATVQLSFLGPVNSTVYLAASSRTGFRPRSFQGVQHVPASSPSLFQIVGTSNGAGQLTEGWVIPELGPGVESRVVHLQPLFVDSSGGYTWGAPVGLVLLDRAF